MTKNYTITQFDDITEIRYNSPPKAQDLMDATLEHAAIGVSRKRLWDMSCGYDVSTDELQRLAATGRAIEMPDKSKVAILAPDDLSFGITRIYSVFRKDPRSKHQVFRDRDEAIAWLNTPFDEIEGLT